MPKTRRHAKARIWCLLPSLALLSWLAAPATPLPAELKKKTIEAFDRYVVLTEARGDEEIRKGSPYLYVDALPEARRQAAYAELRAGQVVIEKLQTRGPDGKEVQVPDGMSHHWVGVVFIPGASLRDTVALLTDYDNHEKIYKPDVTRSKLLERSGDNYKVYLRFHKKKVITVVLNTNHDATYVILDSLRGYSRSHTSRIAEVENPGKSNEREKPVGNDGGFMWRLNTYWRFEERDAGTYVQCEAVSLTRDIPFGLGWLIGPYIRSVPRESLIFTLGSTRTALTRKPAAQPALP